MFSNKVENFYREMYNNIKRIFKNLKLNENINFPTIISVVEDMLKTVFFNQDHLLLLTGFRTSFNTYDYAHSLDVCIYSLITAKAMGLSQDKCLTLGLGALLHDIGKTKVPDQILLKKGKLTFKEFQEVKKHSAYGFQLLQQQSRRIDPTVCRIVLEHHERCNGSGYPNQLQNKEIHQFSKIVAVADIYDALTSDRIFKKKILPHEAAEYLLSVSSSELDPEITRIFLKNIAIYPKGCQVLLNTNQVAVVQDSYLKMPLRPLVQILTDKKGTPLSKPY